LKSQQVSIIFKPFLHADISLMSVWRNGFAASHFTSEVCSMFASITIVILAVLFGSLSIFVQYTKDRERRQKIDRVVSIPAGLAMFGAIFWIMSHAHHLDELGISPLALGMAPVFLLLIPTVTYVFSPAFKDAGADSRHSQSHSRR
jgi:vacuolar-type H+-ATPase subunit I/STV1